jgi:hypothetical protein
MVGELVRAEKKVGDGEKSLHGGRRELVVVYGTRGGYTKKRGSRTRAEGCC